MYHPVVEGEMGEVKGRIGFSELIKVRMTY
jgi:hypothetical protein